jgi:hypothetical protein
MSEHGPNPQKGTTYASCRKFRGADLMKHSGIVQAWVIKPISTLVIIFTLMVFVVGPARTATFAKTGTSAFGLAIGLTFGSLPNLFEKAKTGQQMADGGNSPSYLNPTPPSAKAAPAQPAAPNGKTKPAGQ